MNDRGLTATMNTDHVEEDSEEENGKQKSDLLKREQLKKEREKRMKQKIFDFRKAHPHELSKLNHVSMSLDQDRHLLGSIHCNS